MADLALLLKNRGHVHRERDLLCPRRRPHPHPLLCGDSLSVGGQQRNGCEHTDPDTATNLAVELGRYHEALPFIQCVTLTLTNPFVQQHWACPAPATPEASLARTRRI